MFLHVIDVKYIDAYKIEVAFSNGRKGIVDLEVAVHTFDQFAGSIHDGLFFGEVF